MTVIDLEYTCQKMQSVTYNLGGPAILVPIEFKSPATFFENDLTPFIEPIIKNVAQDPAPSIIKFLPETHAFSIQGSDANAIGSWDVGLRLGFKEFPEFHRECLKLVNIFPDGATFVGAEVPDVNFSVGESFELFLPTFTDAFGRIAQVALDLGSAAEFIEFDPLTHQLRLRDDVNELEQFEGLHKVKINLTDSHKGTKTLIFFIRVNPRVTAEQKVKQKATMPPPRPFIQEVTHDGFVRVGFTRALQIPSFSRNPEFK